MMMMKRVSDDDGYLVMKVSLWWNLSRDESYLVMKVMIVKELMTGDVSPVAMFLQEGVPKVSLLWIHKHLWFVIDLKKFTSSMSRPVVERPERNFCLQSRNFCFFFPSFLEKWFILLALWNCIIYIYCLTCSYIYDKLYFQDTLLEYFLEIDFR